MKNIYLTISLIFSCAALNAATTTRTLGNVVAEERTFEVSAALCQANFKLHSYSSSCTVVDKSLAPLFREEKVGGTEGFVLKAPAAIKDAYTKATFEIGPLGWYVTFENVNGYASRAMSFSEVQPLLTEVVNKLNGKASAVVYTVR